MPQWDLAVVLEYLKEALFEPLEQATWEKLTLKTVFLLLLATGRRRSQIATLAVDEQHIQFSADFSSARLLSKPGFLAKNQVSSWKPDPIMIPAIPPEGEVPQVLCPIWAMKAYLAISARCSP